MHSVNDEFYFYFLKREGEMDGCLGCFAGTAESRRASRRGFERNGFIIDSSIRF